MKVYVFEGTGAMPDFGVEKPKPIRVIECATAWEAKETAMKLGLEFVRNMEAQGFDTSYGEGMGYITAYSSQANRYRFLVMR